MNEFKVGLLSFAALAAIVFMSLKITSQQSGFGSYITYRTMIKDASGIFPKTPIKVAGINAGKIENIELQGNSALITFKVLESVVITEGSQLKIKTVGFLGDKYLEIKIADTTKRLDEMGFIVAEQGGGFEDVVKDASEVVKDVKIIVTSLKDTIAPEGETPPVKKILDDLKETAKNVKDSMASLKRIVKGNEDKINDVVEKLKKFASNIEEATDKNKDGTSISKLNQILDDAGKMANDLKDIVQDVKAGKGTVGKLLVEEEIADEVRETLSGVKKIVTKVDNIRTELALFTGVNTDNGGESDASLKIYPSPERFYELGLSTSELGPDKENTTERTVNGVKTVETTKSTDKDTYRFSVLLGRKIHNWTFKGGVIESTGGLGVDYNFDRIGTKIGLEAYDYREDVGVNLRLSSEIQLWNVFYGKASLEDSLENSRSATFSAGLRFTDEDLKGLIGFFF